MKKIFHVLRKYKCLLFRIIVYSFLIFNADLNFNAVPDISVSAWMNSQDPNFFAGVILTFFITAFIFEDFFRIFFWLIEKLISSRTRG